MNILIGVTLFILSFGVANAATDYYLKTDGVDGESSTATVTPKPASARVTATPTTNTGTITSQTPKPQEASVDAFIKIDTIDGESKETKKGNVEHEWKVEEGESAPGAEVDDIKFEDDNEPITPDFGILLGGGSDGDEASEEDLETVAEILKQGMEEAGQPVETLSLNYEKIKTKVKHEVKLFGFISVPAEASIEIDTKGETKVQFSWWTFLASGKDGDTLGRRVSGILSNVLKTKHDTIKNSINNVR